MVKIFEESSTNNIKKFISQKLSKLEDQSFAAVLRNLIFNSDVDWNSVPGLLSKYMPEVIIPSAEKTNNKIFIENSSNDVKYEYLYDRLNSLSEHHPDLEPQPSMTLADLLEYYFYWASEYNDDYFSEMKEDTPLAKWLKREWANYSTEGI